MIRRQLSTRLGRALAVTVLVGALAAPAAAATTTSGTAAPAGEHGAVRHDVTFIAMMVPHHEMGIEMAEVAKKKASHGKVRTLAAHIDEVQTRQVGEMKDWLERHDAKPMTPPKAVREMEHQDLEMLRSMRKGHMFDAMFLMMMRQHHAQAVAEAEDELHHGRSAFALKMAHTTKTDQSKEIAQMNDLLAMLHREMRHDMAV